MTDNCLYGEVVDSHGHLYSMRCVLPQEHGGRHSCQPAHRLLWEETYGVPPPARVAFLRPIDGNWLNLEIANWEVVTHRQHRQEIAAKKNPEVVDKHCRECGMLTAPEDLAPRRNVCKECWKEHLRKNTRKRADHETEYQCRIVEGKHYHLVDGRDVAMDYMFACLFQRLREEYPDPIRYNQAVIYMRARLRRAVQSEHKPKEGYRAKKP